MRAYYHAQPKNDFKKLYMMMVKYRDGETLTRSERTTVYIWAGKPGADDDGDAEPDGDMDHEMEEEGVVEDQGRSNAGNGHGKKPALALEDDDDEDQI